MTPPLKAVLMEPLIGYFFMSMAFELLREPEHPLMRFPIRFVTIFTQKIRYFAQFISSNKSCTKIPRLSVGVQSNLPCAATNKEGQIKSIFSSDTGGVFKRLLFNHALNLC